MAREKRNYYGNSKGGGGKFNNKRSKRRRGPKKENIHPSKFIKVACIKEQEEYKPKNTFEDFKIPDLIQKNITRQGIVTPSPIQDQSIPQGMAGNDILGIANTGTGKTMSFALPVLKRLLKDKDSKVIIMAPTRELAQQILDEFKMLTRGAKVFWALLIGGTSMRTQLKDLSKKPRIIIGTPGRIQDHIKRKSLNLATVNMVVLDEVDRMLDMGFIDDMKNILGKLAQDRQSFFFSATMNSKVRNLINEFSKDPVTISVKTGNTSDNINQDVVKYRSPDDKFDKLHKLLTENKKNKFLIFDETKRGVDKLNKSLQERGFRVDATHGDKSQGQRKRVLAKFKVNQISVLVATDVAARGIDIKDITHVINYSTPQSYDDYVHRIGRTGRAGRIGHAFTFIRG
ncbi:MAG: DEAD/DEAH box helicase [Candidatus Moranbacteria bacterium]|nr:DEAD/DEAH box helicase [Candidatus Moranbacteria bacterium]